MEVVVDYEYLPGSQNETILKELSIAGENVLEKFHFQSPYAMRTHVDEENGLNWDDGHIAYHQLSTFLSEAVAGFAHLYGYGESKLNCYHNCWGALYTISSICIALRPATSDINKVVPNRLTEIPLSAAQLDMLIPYTISSCTTSGKCRMFPALTI